MKIETTAERCGECNGEIIKIERPSIHSGSLTRYGWDYVYKCLSCMREEYRESMADVNVDAFGNATQRDLVLRQIFYESSANVNAASFNKWATIYSALNTEELEVLLQHIRDMFAQGILALRQYQASRIVSLDRCEVPPSASAEIVTPTYHRTRGRSRISLLREKEIKRPRRHRRSRLR